MRRAGGGAMARLPGTRPDVPHPGLVRVYGPGLLRYNSVLLAKGPGGRTMFRPRVWRRSVL